MCNVGRGECSHGGRLSPDVKMNDVPYLSRLSWVGIRARAWTVAELPKYPDDRSISDINLRIKFEKKML